MGRAGGKLVASRQPLGYNQAIGTPGVATRLARLRLSDVIPDRPPQAGVSRVGITTMAILRGAEIECAKRLAELFERGESVWRNHGKWEELSLTAENYESVLDTMVGLGAIGNTSDLMGSRFRWFTITPIAVQVAREIEKAEKEEQKGIDIVEQITKKARSSNTLAWGIIAFFVLVGLLNMIGTIIIILQNLGWMHKP